MIKNPPFSYQELNQVATHTSAGPRGVLRVCMYMGRRYTGSVAYLVG